MKNDIINFIRENSNSQWKALRNFMTSSIESDFVRKVVETFATRILLIGLGLVTSVIIARILGPEGRGLYSVAVATAAIGTQFGNLGLHASNTYYVAHDRMLLPVLIGNSLFISFVLGSLGGLFAWIVFFIWPNLAPIQGTLLLLAVTWIPFGLAYTLMQNLLLGIQQVRTYNKIEILLQVFGLVLISATIVLHIVSAPIIFATNLIALISSLAWALFGLRQFINKRIELSFALFKENIRYGLKAYLAALFAFLVLRIDLLMVKYLLDAEQAGYYSIAVTIGDMVYMLPVVIGTILFPKLSSLPTNKEKWNFAKKTVAAVCMIMTVTCVFMALLSEPIVLLLFGNVFLPAVPAFLWLLPGILMLSINTIYMNFFASTGMPLITVFSTGAAAILNIALNIKFIPLWGIVGASLASVLAYGFMLLCSLFFTFKIGARLNERQQL